MADGGGHQAGGGVHVHIGLSGKGKVDASKAENALQPRAEQGFCLYGFHVQAGKFPPDVPVNFRPFVKTIRQVRGKMSPFIPGDLAGQGGGLPGEVFSDGGERLHRVGAGLQPLPLSKGGDIVGGVPKPAQPRPQPQPGGSQSDQPAQEGERRPEPAHQYQGPDQPDCTAKQKQGGEHLRHREGAQGPQPAQKPLHRGHDPEDPNAHQVLAGFQQLEKDQQRQRKGDRPQPEPALADLDVVIFGFHRFSLSGGPMAAPHNRWTGPTVHSRPLGRGVGKQRAYRSVNRSSREKRA